MKILPQGPGVWIWRAERSAAGDPDRIADESLRHGFQHVLLKVADGARPFTPNAGRNPRVANRLRAVGVQPVAWGYHYGAAPENEARAAAGACRDLSISTYVLNAEKEFEQPAGARSMRRFIAAFRSAAGPAVSLGLSTFALPDLHPRFPYREALVGSSVCDFIMPQIYTAPSRRHPCLERLNSYFIESRRQLARFNKPLIPTLRAYAGDGLSDWKRIAADAAAFQRAVPGLGLHSWNWWVWEQAETHPATWAAINHHQPHSQGA